MRTILLVLLALYPSLASGLPTLVAERTAAAVGEMACVPIRVEADGAALASTGFLLSYGPELRLPPNAPGSYQNPAVLRGDGPHGVYSLVRGSSVQVLVVPPFRLPIERLGKTAAQVCFTAVAPASCAKLSFVWAEVGSDRGFDVPMAPPKSSCVEVR